MKRFIRNNLSASILLCISFNVSGSVAEHHIAKRALLFPQSTVLQLTYGFSIVIKLTTTRQVVWNSAWQQNYDLPYNLTNFKPTTYYARSSIDGADITRETLYVYLMSIIDNMGLDGEQCLFRAICEVANTPFHVTKKNGVLEKIAQFIFTPGNCCDLDRSLEEESGRGCNSFTREILQATKVGLEKEDCGVVYIKCPLSIVGLISQKYYVE